MLKQRRSSPRLGGFEYVGPHAYFVTCSTYRRRPYFRHKAIVDIVLPVLRRAGAQNGFDVYVYCFMPDHLHLLPVGRQESSLPRFMKAFKQESGFAFRRAYGNALWQRSYYDRVIRKEEALEEVALYILNNPVRRGLVDDCRSYAFSGSFVFQVDEISGQT